MWALGGLQAASGQTAAIATISTSISWHPQGYTGAPVGVWAPLDAFWVDELPIGSFEVPVEGRWTGGILLTSEEHWVSVDSATLTPRQRMLLQTAARTEEVVLHTHPGSVGIDRGLRRGHPVAGYGRLVGGEWVVGEVEVEVEVGVEVEVEVEVERKEVRMRRAQACRPSGAGEGGGSARCTRSGMPSRSQVARTAASSASESAPRNP